MEVGKGGQEGRLCRIGWERGREEGEELSGRGCVRI